MSFGLEAQSFVPIIMALLYVSWTLCQLQTSSVRAKVLSTLPGQAKGLGIEAPSHVEG